MTDIIASIPPSLILILGAFLLPFIKGNYRKTVILILPIITLMHIWQINSNGIMFGFLGFDIMPVYIHPYSHIFATVFCIALFAGGIFGLNQSKLSETMSAFIYAGSALGVVFAGDYITLFIFWELMAIGSTLIIFISDRKNARSAGLRYAYMHFLGGVILLCGIAAKISLSDSILIDHVDLSLAMLQGNITPDLIASCLILVGFLINAAAVPFSSWLPDAYPEASPFGTVYLSAFTTKTAVFVLLTIFAGADILIYIGLFMVFYGIVYAIMENDMRRILAYSVINQVGFMITGIGIGTELALNGVATHAFCHIIYKALLFMSAGSVLYMTGRTKCSELGGLYRTMRLTTICGTIGALAISAFPLTSGFVSKSMISSAAAYEHMQIVWLLLLAASAGVFLHAGIKFPWFVFFQKDSGLRPDEPPLNMRIAMILLSALCIIPAIPGVTEVVLYNLLPKMPNYQAYTGSHVVSQLQLLLFSGLAFFAMLQLLKRTETISLDFDWIYRYLIGGIINKFEPRFGFVRRIGRLLTKKYMRVGYRLTFSVNGPKGVLARNWPIGVTVMWALSLLGVYLILYYR